MNPLHIFKPDYSAMSDETLVRRHRVGHFLGKQSTIIGGILLFIVFGINLIPASLAAGGTLAFLAGISVAHLAGASASYKIAKYLLQNRGITIEKGVITSTAALRAQTHAKTKEQEKFEEEQKALKEQAAARTAQQAFEKAVKKDTVLERNTPVPKPLSFKKSPGAKL